MTPKFVEIRATLRKRKSKVIRFSDLDAIERQEALMAIPVKPFTPIEQAAVNLAEARDDEIEDDEIILLALTRILH